MDYYGIILDEVLLFTKEVFLMTILYVIFFLIFIIVGLIAYAILQIKLFGMNVKDFWSFIEANQILDKLYNYSKRYEKLSPQEQVIFLLEAERIFSAFDKIPSVLWEEEYDKYKTVLESYRSIKMLRWSESHN